jgi:hypothetical protein
MIVVSLIQSIYHDFGSGVIAGDWAVSGVHPKQRGQLCKWSPTGTTIWGTPRNPGRSCPGIAGRWSRSARRRRRRGLLRRRSGSPDGSQRSRCQWLEEPLYRSVRPATPRARFIPTCPTTENGCSTVDRRDPPTRAFAPPPRPRDASALAPM